MSDIIQSVIGFLMAIGFVNFALVLVGSPWRFGYYRKDRR